VIILTAAAAISCGSGSPARPAAPALVERARVAMGSELRLSVWTDDEAAALAAFEEVFGEFDRLESLMSVWRDGSDVQRLNAAAGSQPVPVSPEMREVLGIARQVGDWTGGKFDITFGALADVWRFDQDQDNRVPTPSEIRARLPFVDYQAVEVDERSGTAFIRRKGTRVHLGGIGKGYAVDRGAAILRRRGIGNFMIQAGGDLYVAGARGDRPWRLGIRDPRGPADKLFAALDLSDGTFSTSGDYERFFIKDGRRYHHIIDPDLGEPANGCRSVTIVTDKGVLADALSTGVFVLGPTAGMALVERLPQVEGVIVSAANDVLISSGLKGRLVLLAAPTDIRP
jgi:FAD:protein FMN transferase